MSYTNNNTTNKNKQTNKQANKDQHQTLICIRKVFKLTLNSNLILLPSKWINEHFDMLTISICAIALQKCYEQK